MFPSAALFTCGNTTINNQSAPYVLALEHAHKTLPCTMNIYEGHALTLWSMINHTNTQQLQENPQQLEEHTQQFVDQTQGLYTAFWILNNSCFKIAFNGRELYNQHVKAGSTPTAMASICGWYQDLSEWLELTQDMIAKNSDLNPELNAESYFKSYTQHHQETVQLLRSKVNGTELPQTQYTLEAMPEASVKDLDDQQPEDQHLKDQQLKDQQLKHQQGQNAYQF